MELDDLRPPRARIQGEGLVARGSRRLERQTLRPIEASRVSHTSPRRRSPFTALVLGIAASFVAVVSAHAGIPVERLASAPGLAPFDVPLGAPALLFEASPVMQRSLPVAEPTKVSDLKTNPYRPLVARPRPMPATQLSFAFEHVSDLKTNPYLGTP